MIKGGKIRFQRMMNIFLCYTPLHILISKEIIKKENFSKNWLLFYGMKTKKNLFYFNRFRNLFNKMTFIEEIRNLNNIYRFLMLINELRQHKKNVNFFCGNIKKTISRMFFSVLRNANLYTFDDGSGNISGAGYFYDKNEHFFQKLFFTFLGKNLLYKNIIERIKLHYTIYKLPNVYSPAKYIPLFDITKICSRKNKRFSGEISLMLGNTFYEDGLMSLEEEISIYKKVKDRFGLKYMLPHPRQKVDKAKLANFQVIESEYIAEEIVFDYLFIFKRVKVVGFYSTVLINLASLNFEKLALLNIKVNINKPTSYLDRLFIKLGIQNISI